MRKSMGICRIGSDGRMNRLLYFNLGLVLKRLWKRWVLSDGRCVFANFLAVLIFFSSNIFLSCFHSKSFFKSIFFFFCSMDLFKKIGSKIFFTIISPTHAYIILLNDSLGWRKKKSRNFVNTEQKGAAKLLVQVLPPLVLWLVLIIS